MISRTGYSQGQEIDRILLYHIPISHLPIYGTVGARAEVMNSVFRKFLAGKEEHKAKDNTERVQPITHDARYGSTREATTSKVHRRRLASRFLAWIARHIHSDLPYHISKYQSAFDNACVRDSRQCKLHCRVGSICIHTWYSFIPDSSRDNAIVARFSDDSMWQDSGTT